MARIVFVENEPALARLFSMRLRDAGHEVVTAASMAQAMPLCHETSTDLVIVDWMLDGAATGGDIATALARECPRVKVIVMTGLPEEMMTVATIMPNVVKVLLKPIDFHELEAAVAEALN